MCWAAFHVAETKEKINTGITCTVSRTYRIQCLTRTIFRLVHYTVYARLICLWLNFWAFSHVKWSFTLPKDTKYQLNVVYSQFDTPDDNLITVLCAVRYTVDCTVYTGTRDATFDRWHHILSLVYFLWPFLVFGVWCLDIARSLHLWCEICFFFFHFWSMSVERAHRTCPFLNYFRGVTCRVYLLHMSTPYTHINNKYNIMNIALAVMH